MRKWNRELIVGVFVILAMVCFVYLTVRIGRLELMGGAEYGLEAQFTGVGGLAEGSPAYIAGVRVGEVTAIKLDGQRATVALEIDRGIEVRDDAVASIKTRGLLGETFVAISPGTSGTILQSGERIRRTEPAVDIQSLLASYAPGPRAATPGAGEEYELRAVFTNVGGLTEGAPVAIAGVPVGRVKQIALRDYQADVVLGIAAGTEVQEDAIASIKSRGLLGGGFVAISPGASEVVLSPGDRIRETEPAIDLASLIAKYAFQTDSGGGLD
ncbi:MAG: MlaD family protein [bacterium]